MYGLSAEFSRYLSHSVKIPSHAQGQEHQHGACSAELPGICDVNLVSHTMGDGISQSAYPRCTCPCCVHGQGQTRTAICARKRAALRGVLSSSSGQSDRRSSSSSCDESGLGRTTASVSVPVSTTSERCDPHSGALMPGALTWLLERLGVCTAYTLQ